MKIVDWLTENTQQLQSAGIATSRLDCLVLLEECIEKNRAYIIAHPEFELDTSHIIALSAQIARRMTHEPLAYIRGKTDFFEHEFVITPRVLEPRPESEAIIELLQQHQPTGTIIDVGCGSGALGITAKLAFPKCTVLLLDIDPQCLQVAQQNSIALHANCTTIQSDLLASLTDNQVNDATLIANLPYVPDSFPLNKAAMHEPRLAIFGGPDGLDVYRKLFNQISSRNLSPQALYCESLPSQHEALTMLAGTYNFVQAEESDFIQVFNLSAPLQA